MCCTCAILYFDIKHTRGFIMTTPAQRETMLRKPILMPSSMIDKVDKIANERKVSFAEVVREAVDAFDGDLSMEDEALVEALADTMIKTTREVVEKIDAIEKRLDETHAMLEAK
jgi:chlorite dismutase